MSNWRKSTYSNGGADACIEVASTPGTVAVRDTKQEGRRDRTTLSFTPAAWARFTGSLG